jgi:ribosomal protein S18 acetylase RimI-like enzyme
MRTERVPTFRLMVELENESALRLYRQTGFVRVRRIHDYYGPGRDAWRMRLRLS